MTDHGSRARVTEIISGSPKSFEHALQMGFKRASKTLRGIAEITVSDFRCKVENEGITEYRVTLRIAFILDS